MAFIIAFVSGFFFLDQGIEQTNPNEPSTSTVDYEGIMAVRLNHVATAFKVEKLKKTPLTKEELHEELSPYLGESLLSKTTNWLNGEVDPQVEAFVSVDTSHQPIVTDETEEGISIVWDMDQSEQVKITYRKPADLWVADHVEITEKEGVRE
ncbi:hypothetical protein J2S05_001592 [Alkalicoccobacillus murimartini]|uniref:Uncharacterized protein n=2 Tax=Alkalicoccobacillus murimartini TaxID=171685 RepID=A0ABT9YG06_9BACI|nr:hypothetical protein [Alkalicoccobacillus murimartini]